MFPPSSGARAIAGFGLFIWWMREKDRLRQRRTRITLQRILELESWIGPETPTLASYNPILGSPQVGVIILVRGPGGALADAVDPLWGTKPQPELGTARPSLRTRLFGCKSNLEASLLRERRISHIAEKIGCK